jgi:hypothetical protein
MTIGEGWQLSDFRAEIPVHLAVRLPDIASHYAAAPECVSGEIIAVCRCLSPATEISRGSGGSVL